MYSQASHYAAYGQQPAAAQQHLQPAYSTYGEVPPGMARDPAYAQHLPPSTGQQPAAVAHAQSAYYSPYSSNFAPGYQNYTLQPQYQQQPTTYAAAVAAAPSRQPYEYYNAPAAASTLVSSPASALPWKKPRATGWQSVHPAHPVHPVQPYAAQTTQFVPSSTPYSSYSVSNLPSSTAPGGMLSASTSTHIPAYIPVPAAQPPPSAVHQEESAQANNTASSAKAKFSEQMKKYLGRAFLNCPKEEHAKLHAELTVFCKGIAASGKMHSIDWDNYPLPAICRTEMFADPPPPSPILKRKRNKSIAGTWTIVDEEEFKQDKRKHRFRDSLADTSHIPASDISISSSEQDEELLPSAIVGTCQVLEKKYFRLTSEPDPSSVRPPSVLKRTLDLLRLKAREGASYAYLCDQYKSMRQDLTVQRVLSEFTVIVYEEHAKLALLNRDLGEYNQCQTQLKRLYTMGLPGSVMEFIAYRLLYFLHTKNQTAINAMMAELTEEQKRDSAVRHALQVRVALSTGNFHALFRLLRQVPNLGEHLMIHFVERERIAAIKIICRAYRPTIPTDFVQRELGFNDADGCRDFFESHELLAFVSADQALDTKACIPQLDDIWRNKFSKIDIKGQV